MQPYNMVAIFTSGIVLLLNIWGGRRKGRDPRGGGIDVGKEMADVYKCMLVLGLLEERWHSAGRLWDILAELASVGELPLPNKGPPTQGDSTTTSGLGTKRGWEDADVDLGMSSFVDSSSVGRSIASNKRVVMAQTQGMGGYPSSVPQQPPTSVHQHQQQQQQHSSSSGSASSTPSFQLPVHSNELGRLPLHAYPMGIPPQSQAQSQQPQPQPHQNWFPHDPTPMGYTISDPDPPPNSFFHTGGSPFYTGGGGGGENDFSSILSPGFATPSGGGGGGGGVLDNETMTMWSNAPSGFE